MGSAVLAAASSAASALFSAVSLSFCAFRSSFSFWTSVKLRRAPASFDSVSLIGMAATPSAGVEVAVAATGPGAAAGSSARPLDGASVSRGRAARAGQKRGRCMGGDEGRKRPGRQSLVWVGREVFLFPLYLNLSPAGFRMEKEKDYEKGKEPAGYGMRMTRPMIRLFSSRRISRLALRMSDQRLG